jgi:hypothetical protein
MLYILHAKKGCYQEKLVIAKQQMQYINLNLRDSVMYINHATKAYNYLWILAHKSTN